MQELLNALQMQYQNLLENSQFQQHTLHYFQKILPQLPQTPHHCARELIYQCDQIRLYRYYSSFNKNHLPPLLLVYAFINRPTILDLCAERSFIAQLLQNKIDVYLLEWGNPTTAESQYSLSHYIHNYLNNAITCILKFRRIKQINLLGVCQGGVLSLIYAALYPKKIRRLISMVTPIDFHTDNHVLSQWLKQFDTQALLHHLPNIPGTWLSWGLQSLRPFRLLQDKYFSLLRDPSISLKNLEFFLRMEQWIQDCPDHPGKAFHEFIYYFYQRNALIKNQYWCDKQWVDLSQIKMPLLNIYATQDHLIPNNSSLALAEYVGTTDYTAVAFNGGHIGVFVSQEALKTLPITIGDWIN